LSRKGDLNANYSVDAESASSGRRRLIFASLIVLGLILIVVSLAFLLRGGQTEMIPNACWGL
jgi:hypothetical protein